MSKIVCSKRISRNYNDPLISHLWVNKTKELIGRKYYWPSLINDIKSYIKKCDVYWALKSAKHKPYGNFPSLPTTTHRWTDLLIDFVTWLPILTDWKGDNYNFIQVIVNWLTKIVYYKPVQVTINALGLAEVILDIVVWHYDLPNSIVFDRYLLLTLKFCSSLCYFLSIKKWLSIMFHL